MRLNLKVPFAEKDQAKKLGARWDPAGKLWYIDSEENIAACARWSPTPHAVGAGESPAKAPATPRQSAGKLVVGSAYVAQTPACACPPWQLCEMCRPLALAP